MAAESIRAVIEDRGGMIDFESRAGLDHAAMARCWLTGAENNNLLNYLQGQALSKGTSGPLSFWELLTVHEESGETAEAIHATGGG